MSRHWEETAIIDRLLVNMAKLTTPEVMAGLKRLVTERMQSEGFECVFSAAEQTLLSRGEGLSLLPEEWRA